MPGVEEPENSVRKEIAEILDAFRQGRAEFDGTVQILRDYFETLSAEQQTEYFGALANHYSSEPFDKPKAVHMLIIHVWAAIGQTDDLVSKIFSGLEWIDSARAKSWNLSIGGQFVHSLWCFPQRFSKSTVDRIKAQSRALASTGIPDLVEIASRLDRSVERINLDKRASGYRQKARATQAADGNDSRSSLRKLRKRPSTRSEPRAVRPPGESRARTVARLIKELDTLKPSMNDEQHYVKLARRHPDFLCFKTAKKYDHLREKLVNLQGHKQHVRLAQELAAAASGKELSTIQTDWKKYKPLAFRQNQGRRLRKSPEIPKNP